MVAYITWVTASRGQLLMNPTDKFFLLVSAGKKSAEKQHPAGFFPLPPTTDQSLGVLFDQKKVEGAVHPHYNAK